MRLRSVTGTSRQFPALRKLTLLSTHTSMPSSLRNPAAATCILHGPRLQLRVSTAPRHRIECARACSRAHRRGADGLRKRVFDAAKEIAARIQNECCSPSTSSSGAAVSPDHDDDDVGVFVTLPIAVGFGAGSDLRQPLGVAVVGGLIVSQALTLFTTNVTYLYIERLSSWTALRLAWLRRSAATVPA
jgi:hypothetical protein